MNDRISGDNHAIVLAGMSTALVVVLSLLGFYMPLLSTVVFLLIPLPIAYLGMKEGVKWSVVVTTGVLVLDSTFFGIVSAAFVCAIFGLLGVVMGICYRFRVSAAKTLLAGAVVVLCALVAEGIATLYLLGLPSLMFGGEGLAQVKESMLEALPSFYSGEALDQAKEKVDFLMDAMEKSVPYTLVAVSVFYSWASMTLGSHVFKKMGITDIPHLPPFERWELPKGTLALYLVVLACQYFFKDQEQVSYVAYNLGTLCVSIFWLQGLAVTWWLPHRYPVIRPLRLFIMILSAFIGVIQMFVVFLGIADMAASYRKKRNYQ
ncbi:YybS family protein [Dialister sp.]|uniref:YybS family protein n=1 Tax=Dialister sp. TaxID=1955814 RepID=UPI003F0BD12E